MLTNQELQEALTSRPAERVTKEQMESHILDKEFTRLGKTVTHCRLVLDNGYSVSGESACVSVENYNQLIGEKIAFDNAFQKLWPLFGFLLAEKRMARYKDEPLDTTGLSVLGLNVRQIKALADFYEQETGRAASAITIRE